MRYYLRHLDHLMLATALAISSFGLWIIHNATRDDILANPTYFFDRQLAYVCVGTVGMLVLAAVPTRTFRRAAPFLYGFVLLSLVAVLVVGQNVKGGQRWINLGLFQFQPSELGKLLLVIGLAALMVNRRGSLSPSQLTLAAIAYMSVPALLVFMEPDFGTALVYAAITFGMLFVNGAPWRHFAWMGLAGVVAIAMIFSILPGAGIEVLQPYQKDRLTSFLHPDQVDTQGNGYHLTQSKIAIGSGGITGKGVEGATQTRLNYLPEHATDFIFSVVGEERGFVGTAWLLGVYLLLIWGALKIVTYSRSTFGSLLAAGIVSTLMFQIFINVGMTIGIAPITGIPLPFMSYGGSSIIVSFACIGLVANVRMRRFS